MRRRSGPIVNPQAVAGEAALAEYKDTRKALESDSRYGDYKKKVVLSDDALRSGDEKKSKDEALAGKRLYKAIDREVGYSRACTKLGQLMAAGFSNDELRFKAEDKKKAEESAGKTRR